MDNKFYANDETNKLKYLAYVRKSTEEEDRQIMSKEAQVEEIKRQFPNLNIVFMEDKNGCIGESMSAAKPGRPVFSKMIELLENGKYQGIIAWHPDRLSRNMPDAARIIWQIQNGTIKDLKFCNFTFEKTPEGIMMLQMIMSQAQYFSAKLGKDVKRGNKRKREKGQLTGIVPAGYISVSPTNNGRNTHAKPDPKRFDILQKAMKMYLSGAYTAPEIIDWLNNDCGYLSVKRAKTGNKPMSRSAFYSMLKNPRYAGLIPDPEYPGDPNHYLQASYEPMITVDEYNRIQKLLGKSGNRYIPHNLDFSFKGLFTCGTCGHAITADRHTKESGKTYVYYHCTHKSKHIKCHEKGVEEKELARQLDVLLAQYTISDELYHWGLKALDELAKKEKDQQFIAQDLQLESSKTLQERLNRLLDLVTDGIISPEEYTRKSGEIRKQLENIQEKQAENSERLNDWYNIVENTLMYLCNANERYKTGSVATKKLIANAIGSNPKITDKRVIIKPHYWVKPIADFIQKSQGETKEVRTKNLQRKNSLNRAEITKWCSIMLHIL